MKSLHFLLAALVALPIALVGCDANSPESGSPFAAAAISKASATSSTEKGGGPIHGPTSITAGPVETYYRVGATDMRLKGLNGSAEVVDEYSVNGPEGVPTRYLEIRGLSAGDVQIEADHPNFGKSFLSVNIVEPPACDTSFSIVNGISGPRSIRSGQSGTYSAIAELSTMNLSASLTITDEYRQFDPPGRAYIEVLASGDGNARVIADFGDSQTYRTVRVCPSDVMWQ